MIAQGDLVRRQTNDLRRTLALDGAGSLGTEERISLVKVVGDAHDTTRFPTIQDGQADTTWIAGDPVS